MTRTPARRDAARMLATVRPGPVLHLWRDGRELAAVPLASSAALRLAADLLRAVMLAQDDEGDAR